MRKNGKSAGFGCGSQRYVSILATGVDRPRASCSVKSALMTRRELAPDALNQRETEIVRRLASGLFDQQIADDLYLSVNTVKWYNRQIYSKLGVSSRTQAIAWATRQGASASQGSPTMMSSSIFQF